MQLLDIGEPIPVRTTWWDKAGALADPTAIALTLTKPDGAIITKSKAEMTADGTGIWTYETTADVAGAWLIHAEATIVGERSIQDATVLVGDTEHVGPVEPWCEWEDVLRCGTLATDPDEISKQLWLEQATEILYALSDQHYPGIRTVTRSMCWACNACYPDVCSCVPWNALDLGGRFPVWGVYNVTVDGVTLDPSAYRLRGKRWLIRTDGQGWPTGWNTVDPDAWRVTWATGRLVPIAGRLAAARFVLEIAKRCSGDKSCSLPSRVTTVNREGMTFTVLDSMALIAEGRTGLDLVDLWVVSDRQGRKAKPGIFHPAQHGSRRI